MTSKGYGLWLNYFIEIFGQIWGHQWLNYTRDGLQKWLVEELHYLNDFKSNAMNKHIG